jgi:hypothetical protein
LNAPAGSVGISIDPAEQEKKDLGDSLDARTGLEPSMLAWLRLARPFLFLPLLLMSALAGSRPADAQQEPRLNRTIQTLDDDQPVFGMFSGDFSYLNALAVARSGLDFVLLDMEPNPWNPETLWHFLHFMPGKGPIASSEVSSGGDPARADPGERLREDAAICEAGARYRGRICHPKLGFVRIFGAFLNGANAAQEPFSES